MDRTVARVRDRVWPTPWAVLLGMFRLVRASELIDRASGARIELEGNRLPVTHSKDVIEALVG
jgi:hypothetical protein